MARRVPVVKIEEIKRLRSEGLTIDEIVRRTGCSISTVYVHTGAAERNFASRKDYERFLNERRQKRQSNMELSFLIEERLLIIGRSQYWLAGRLGISKSAVTLYAQGKRMPRESIYRKLLNELGVPYIPLDELHKRRLATGLEDNKYLSGRFLTPQ